MRRWIWAMVIAVVLSVVALGFLGGARTALAAGPDPSGNNPWDIVDNAPVDGQVDDCTTNHGAAGHLLINTKSGKTHCFPVS